MPLQHPRQIPAPRTAWIIHVVRNLLRALGCQFIEPIDHLAIAATLIDEAGEAVATVALALGAVRVGILLQILSAAYRSGPTRTWIKVKNPDAPAATRAQDGTF